jgi:hypothetical protein
MKNKVIILEAAWADSSPEQLHDGAWKVEGTNGMLYCVDTEDVRRAVRKERILDIMNTHESDSDFLVFLHRWPSYDMEDIQEHQSYSSATAKFISIAYGTNFVYYNPEKKTGLVRHSRLGCRMEEKSDSNDVVKSYEDHELRKKNFQEVWDFYFFEFDKRAASLREAITQFFGFPERLWSVDTDQVDFLSLLEKANQYQLVKEIQVFVGVNSDYNKVNIPKYIKEQRMAHMREKYDQLSNELKTCFVERRAFAKSEGVEKLMNIRELFLEMLTCKQDTIYE